MFLILNQITSIYPFSPAVESKQRQVSKLNLIEMLDSKERRKTALKEKELELRSKELQLKRDKFDAEERVNKQHEEEQKLRLEMEFEERKLTLELLKKLVNKD